MTDPTVTLTCKPRSPEAVAEVVAMINPESPASELQPGGGLTHCNSFVHQATALLGCPVPQMLANLQLAWLAGAAGKAAGWRQMLPVGAVNSANLGQPVVVGWVNPTPGEHGHIALVRATPPGETGIWITQAGAHNYNLTRLIHGFGNHAPLVWFDHP